MKAPARAGEREAITAFLRYQLCFTYKMNSHCEHDQCLQLADWIERIDEGAHLER